MSFCLYINTALPLGVNVYSPDAEQCWCGDSVTNTVEIAVEYVREHVPNPNLTIEDYHKRCRDKGFKYNMIAMVNNDHTTIQKVF